MPTASTSQILGNNECIEPFTSNTYSRSTLAGEFLVVNKYLQNSLTRLVKRVEKRAREWYASQSPRFRRLVKFDQVTMTFMLFTDGYDNRFELDKDGKMLAEAIREFRGCWRHCHLYGV